jgi:hypothetical protein
MISISTMTKNQANRLEEWILYHNNIGFEHFIIFLDDCSDNSENVLINVQHKYKIKIDIYLVELMNPNYKNLHWINRSHEMYNSTLNKYKNLTDWIAFIEVDEFIFNYKNDIKLIDFLKNLNSKCLYINSWDFKGPFDLSKKILGQSYLCWTDQHRFTNGYKYRGKSIIQPKFWNKCMDAHHFRMINNEVPHKDFKNNRENFLQVSHGENVYIDDNIFRIGHFRNHSPSTNDSNFNEFIYNF